MATSKTNTSDRITLTSEQAKVALQVCVVANRGAILLGSPGGGKTSLVRSVARSIGAAFISSPPLPTLDPTDLRGIPAIVEIDGVRRSVCSVPDFLPLAPPTSGRGLILYDDFTTAPPAVQAPFYQLWLEGQLGTYQLPTGYTQFATGNYDTDRAGTHRSLTPMRSRWVTLHLASDADSFVRGAAGGWGVNDEPVTLPIIEPRPRLIRPETLGFIRFRPALLNAFDADQLSYPCERSHEIASDLLYAMEAMGGVDPVVEHALIAGTLGMGCGAEFLGFLRHFRSLPDIDSIIRNPKKALVPTEPAALYAVAAALARKASVATIAPICDYLARIPAEFQAFSLRDAVKRDNAIARTKAFADWAVANQGLVL